MKTRENALLSASKMTAYAKGRREEEALVKLLRKLGFPAERVPLSGSTRRDKADLVVGELAISVKYGKSCPNALYLASMGWLGEILVVPLIPWLLGCINRWERLPSLAPKPGKAILREVQQGKVMVGRQKRDEWKLAGYIEDLLKLKGGVNAS